MWSDGHPSDSRPLDIPKSEKRDCSHYHRHSFAKNDENNGPLEHTRNVNPSLARHFVLTGARKETAEVIFRREVVTVAPLELNPSITQSSTARVFEIVGPRMQIRSQPQGRWAGEVSKWNGISQNAMKEDLQKEMSRFWLYVERRLDSIIVCSFFLIRSVADILFFAFQEHTDRRRQFASTTSSSQSDSRLKQLKTLWTEEELYKSLPGLPPDDQDGDTTEGSTGDGEKTPTEGGGRSGTITPTQRVQSSDSEKPADTLTAPAPLPDLQSESTSDLSIAPTLPPKDPLLSLHTSRRPDNVATSLQGRIRSLRTIFRETGQYLDALLASASVEKLNDVRRKFWEDGNRALDVINALEGAAGSRTISPEEIARMAMEGIPEWWRSDEYRIPLRRGCVLVREGDWGSVIGHVLSLRCVNASIFMGY